MPGNVDFKISPENLLKWENFEDWEDGASSAPTEHTLSGAGASVARESTIIKEGTYSAGVTRAGADVDLYHDFPDYLDYAGRKMTFGMWVYASVASRARIAVDDGINVQVNSSYHSGGSSWEFLTVTINVSASATQIRVICEVNTGNTTAYFDGGILCEGDLTMTVLSDIADISDITPVNRYLGQTHKVTRRDGVLMPNIVLEGKSIQIKGLVIDASSPASARDNYDTLMKAVNSLRKKPNLDATKNDLYMFDDRFYRCLLDSSDFDPTAAFKGRNFKLRFTAPDPYLQYVQFLRTKQTIDETPESFTVTVNGNAPARPIITITNNVSNVTSIVVENLTTGRSFSYSGVLAAGQDLVVDTDKVTVENNGVVDIANASGIISDFVLYPGGNQLVVSGLVNGVIKVDWRDRWFT